MLSGWVNNENGISILGMANDVRLSKDGQLTFNRKTITRNQLKDYARAMRTMNPSVFLTLAIEEDTSCEDVRLVRAVIDNGMDCDGENRGLCGEGNGPWPVFSDVSPFPVVQEYQDGKSRWLEPALTKEEWRAKVARHPEN